MMKAAPLPQMALDGTPIPAGLSKEKANDYRLLRSPSQLSVQWTLGILGNTFNKGGRVPKHYEQWTPEERTAYAWLFNLCSGPPRRLFLFLKRYRVHGGATEMRPDRFTRPALQWKQEYSYLASNDPKQRDLRHLATLVKLLAVRAPHLLAPGVNVDDVHIEAFDSVPRAMRLCFRFGVLVVLMEAVFRQGHEAAKTFRFVEVCAAIWPAHVKIGGDVRTWCSWLAFLLEFPELTADQVVRLVAALQADGFPVPPFDANEGCEGNTFVVLFLSFNGVFEQPLTNSLVENMPLEVAASINPNAVGVPAPMPAHAIVPPPLTAAVEQEYTIDHDDEDGAPLPLPPPPSTPPQSPFGGADQFPSHLPHEDDDTLALSGAEDDDEEHKAQQQPMPIRELASPPPFDELDEEQQSNEQSASNLLAHDAAAVGLGHFASAAAASSIGAPQSMTDIPVSVSTMVSPAPSSTPASRSARKRSSPPSSSASSNDEGDEPPAIRRKLVVSSPSPSSPLAPLLFSTGPAVKSGLVLAQDEGAAAAAGATAVASWDAIFIAATECSSHLLSPPLTPAASPPSPTEIPSPDDFDPSSLFADE